MSYPAFRHFSLFLSFVLILSLSCFLHEESRSPCANTEVVYTILSQIATPGASANRASWQIGRQVGKLVGPARRAGRDLRDLRDLREVAGVRLRAMPFASAKQMLPHYAIRQCKANAAVLGDLPVRSPQAYSLCKAPTQAHPGGLGDPGGPGQGTFQRQRASRLSRHRTAPFQPPARAFPATGLRLSCHRTGSGLCANGYDGDNWERRHLGGASVGSRVPRDR